MGKKTAIFIPGFGAGDKYPLIYLPLLNRLKCFDDIYVLFDENRCLKHNISTISQKNATYIQENIMPNTSDLYFIGHSMGGLQCMDVLINNPEIMGKTKSLTTIATPIYGAKKATEYVKGKYKSVNDMQKNSSYLKNLNNKWENKETPPVLNIQAGFDFVINTNDSRFLGNEYVSNIKTATHLTILYYPRTALEIYGFNTYKVMEKMHLDINPLIHFRKI